MKCQLCDRELGDQYIDEHHLIPKTFGGKETEKIHKICHMQIHILWTEKELQKEFNTWEKIKSDNRMKTFIDWVKHKPPEFFVKSRDSKTKRFKRKHR